MTEFKLDLYSKNDKKISYMRNPPIQIHHKINKNTCGERLYGRREFQKETESGAAHKVADQFNSCGS